MSAPVTPRSWGGDTRLVTGEAVTLDVVIARLPSRLIAFFLDMLVSVVLLLATIPLLLFALRSRLDEAVLQAVLVTTVVFSLLGYPVLSETFFRGRTLGKLALGLRVVRDDGGPIAFRQALVRELVGVVTEKVGPLLGFPALICMLVREDSKRLGDLAAGTIVINERMVTMGGPVEMPPALAGWAATLDLSTLPSPLALQARQLLGRAHQLSPVAREQLGAQLVAEVARYAGPPPPGTPGWAYLAAVLAERRRRDQDRLLALPNVGAESAVPQQKTRPVGQAAYDDAWPASVRFPA